MAAHVFFFSHFQQQACRRLEAVFNADEESNSFLSIDEAVIVAEGKIHHRSDDDLAVHGDGPLLDGMHAENTALRRVENGRAEQ